jgi:Rrf2 family nitric oxide-sensitive transcriptional repressor
MKLQQRTDFALRALVFLADSGGATPSTIATAHGISRSHVGKVMFALSAAGFVNAQRGRGKLTTLARSPEQITVGEVVRALEPLGLTECFGPDSACSLTNACGLQGALERAGEAFLQSLDSTTLESLRSRHTKRLVLLTPARPTPPSPTD